MLISWHTHLWYGALKLSSQFGWSIASGSGNDGSPPCKTNYGGGDDDDGYVVIKQDADFKVMVM
jgi:hypothetical protein